MGEKYHFKNVSETKIVISMPLSFSLDCETIRQKSLEKRLSLSWKRRLFHCCRFHELLMTRNLHSNESIALFCELECF